jgi:hypothetical protein
MRNDPDQYGEQITRAAFAFLREFMPALPETFEGHVETEIAGAATVAGVVLLRETLPNLDEFPGGTVVTGDFVDRLYLEQHRMQALFMVLAGQMGIDPDGGWDDEVPPDHAPIMETRDLTRLLEPVLRAACSVCHVPDEYRAHVAGLATMELVAAAHADKLLDQRVGKAIAMSSVVAGSRTVPYPVEPPSV